MYAADQLLSFYDRKIDLTGMLGDMPAKQDESDSNYFCRLLQRLNFRATVEHVADLDLSQLDRPHFVVTEEKDYALVMPSKSHGKQQFVFAQDSKHAKSLASAPYSGEIIVLDEMAESIGDYIAHMKTGHSLDWFWRPLVQYRRNYYEILMATIFINLIVLAVPLYSMNIYDRVAINFVQETHYILTIGVIIALGFDFFFKTIRSYILERLAERLGRDYDFKLMERLMNIRSADAPLSVGEQSNMFRELQSIRDFYASKLVPTFVDLPFIILFLFIIYSVGGNVVFVPITIITIIALLNMNVHLPIAKLMEQYFSTNQAKSKYLIETLNGMSTLRMFNAHSSRLFHWDQITANASRVNRHHNILMAGLSNFTFFLSQISHVLVIFFGIFLIHEGQLTVGGLITCTILSGRAIAPAMNLSSLLARVKQTQDVLKAIDNFFKLPHFDEETLSKAPKGPFKGDLKLTNINYTYPGQSRPAIHDITLSIPSGAHMGIIGQSAAGKTTLAKVIGDILAPQSGEITLDNILLDKIPHTELCRTISYAPQDSQFFNGTVLHNITLGRTDITAAALEQAIHISGLKLVLQHNAQGLDMEVGENGCFLSGGQKQALSLARALARDPKILIFDEPTTGMDSNLEAHLQKELQSYLAGRTFIMITHRTSLLPLVDNLVFIDRGHIAAVGPRDEVLKKLAGKGKG